MCLELQRRCHPGESPFSNATHLYSSNASYIYLALVSPEIITLAWQKACCNTEPSYTHEQMLAACLILESDLVQESVLTPEIGTLLRRPKHFEILIR